MNGSALAATFLLVLGFYPALIGIDKISYSAPHFKSTQEKRQAFRILMAIGYLVLGSVIVDALG
ncbi:hypothetical protein ACSMXM_01270 [Pacificimonas sp. ICDLI1SI03]